MIQPILKASCVECHDAKNPKGGLRLDNRADAFKGGDSGPSIVPGEAKESLLLTRVRGEGDEAQMPLKKPALPQSQIDLLTAWVAQGADWPAAADGEVAKSEVHWAYVKPVRAEPPRVAKPAWAANPIDQFVLAALEKQGLQPSPEATREKLIRRVTLDLIGLPPTLAEVEAFVNDKDPNAYGRVVDRLLASPRYGERWARPWLDLARYADSSGYEADQLRSMWPFRDWVINALNADMPFDQFTIEQIAGDLLPNATRDQKIASGFHRNSLMNFEGGVDEDEYYYHAAVDRANTTGIAWLGSTINCAQCHNHKFDPFTHKDYFRLYAFFNSTAPETAKKGGIAPQDISPKIQVDVPEVDALRAEVASLRARLEGPMPELSAAQAQWEQQVGEVGDAWVPLDSIDVTSTGSTKFTRLPDGSILATGDSPVRSTYVVTAKTKVQGIVAVRLEVLPDDSLPHKGPGRSDGGNFALTHFELAASRAGGAGQPASVPLRDASADYSQDGWPVAKAIGEPQDVESGWAIMPRVGQPHTAVFRAGAPVGFQGGTQLTFTLRHDSKWPQHTIGRFRLSISSAAGRPPPVAKGGVLPADVAAALASPADRRSTAEAKRVSAYFRSIAPSLQPVRERIGSLERQIAAYPATTLVMQELPEPRDSFIHLRGAYLAPGDKVEPGIPTVFKALTGQGRQTRLDLARWLCDPSNPLTARVAVNRMWSQYFGRGIVYTSEDFGTQGERPTHPKLLDWLATEFVRQGWSQKAIHRLIVTSSTYRQSSDVTPRTLEKDPENRLLARGPRFRLEAEMIRDQALAAGGLLSSKMGGRPVFPLQPAGIWNSPYSGEKWVTSEGEDRYRRSVYTFLRRSALYPQFATFDMASRDTTCTRRSRTNTPLQALTTLNDPAFMEAASALARRILADGGETDADRIAFAFRIVLARQPRAEERQQLLTLHQQMQKAYSADLKAAEAIASSGGNDSASPAQKAELAAWTMVSNVLLNLDEVLTKN